MCHVSMMQETMCLDSGCYVVNFLGCCDCKKKDTPVQHSRVEQDSNDGKETITFERTYFFSLATMAAEYLSTFKSLKV